MGDDSGSDKSRDEGCPEFSTPAPPPLMAAASACFVAGRALTPLIPPPTCLPCLLGQQDSVSCGQGGTRTGKGIIRGTEEEAKHVHHPPLPQNCLMDTQDLQAVRRASSDTQTVTHLRFLKTIFVSQTQSDLIRKTFKIIRGTLENK